MAWTQYNALEDECEKLVMLLDQHGLFIKLLKIDSDLCHPDTFRKHGEYGLWVESVYEMLVEHDLALPLAVRVQMESLTDLMAIRGDRIP